MNLFRHYPDIVTLHDLCAMLKISKNTAYRLLHSGEIPSIRVGSKYLIPKESVIEYISKKLG